MEGLALDTEQKMGWHNRTNYGSMCDFLMHWKDQMCILGQDTSLARDHFYLDAPKRFKSA